MNGRLIFNRQDGFVITIKALAEYLKPDHDTIATFISTNSDSVNNLFIQILIQCQELDLIIKEMFEIDECKLIYIISKEMMYTV